MKESEFQKKVIDRIKREYPDAIIMKTDPKYIQGLPDLVALYHGKYACFEVKKSDKSARRPNQEYYIEKLADRGFAFFIYPENFELVFDRLSRWF